MAVTKKKRGKLGIILGLVAGLGLVGVIAALLMVIVMLIGAGGAGWYFLSQASDEGETALIEAIDAQVQQVEDAVDDRATVEPAPVEDVPQADDATTDDTADPAVEDAEVGDALASEAPEDALADDAAPVELVAASPAPAPAPAPTRRPRRRPAPSSVPRSTASPSTSGTPTQIKLLSSPPNATLVVDGENHGVTPAKFELTSGSHQVEIRSAGETGKFTIRVSPSGTNKWCYDFDDDAARQGSCL